LTLPRWSKCPTCGNSHAEGECDVPTDPLRMEKDRYEAIAAFRSLGVPLRVAKVLMSIAEEGAAPTPALARAREFVERDVPKGRCLVLAGRAGVGKTVAAAEALRLFGRRRPRFLTGDHRNRGAFFYLPKLCRNLVRDDARIELGVPIRTAVMEFGLVVLDDFGAEYVKAGGLLEADLEEILWTRHADELATIITTNLTLGDLREKLSSRIMDRLREWAYFFPVVGPSLRRDRAGIESDEEGVTTPDGPKPSAEEVAW
jgi:DNA replication protein DnaC